MNDFEAAVAEMLSARAERLEPAEGHRESTLRGARRRRVGTALGAGALSMAIVLSGLGVVRAVDDAPAPRPYAPDVATESSGTYGFTSTPGEYPYVATGEFRDAQWELRVAAIAPHRDDSVRITLGADRPRTNLTTTFQEVRRVDPIVVGYEDGSWFFDRDVAVVFGAVAPEAATVDVWINHIDRPDRTFDAHLFERHDPKTGLRADYFVAFVPAGTLGLVIAKDADGDEVGVATIPQR